MKAVKTEHAGAKNGGGYWGRRRVAKAKSRKLRRRADKRAGKESDGGSPEPFDYGSIPCRDAGKVILMIYPPGAWMDDKGYNAFVGGCGVGSARTLRAAERILMREAQAYCQRRSDAASAELTHWTVQLELLKRQQSLRCRCPHEWR